MLQIINNSNEVNNLDCEILSLETARKKAKYDFVMEHIENRILVLITKLKHSEKDKYNEGKLIGAIKELELLKSILEVKEGN